MKENNLLDSSKIKFEYKNIYNLGNEKFDFVFCFGVLYHLKNPYKALENLFEVTNDTLIIAGPDEKISDVVRPTNISAD